MQKKTNNGTSNDRILVATCSSKSGSTTDSSVRRLAWPCNWVNVLLGRPTTETHKTYMKLLTFNGKFRDPAISSGSEIRLHRLTLPPFSWHTVHMKI